MDNQPIYDGARRPQGAPQQVVPPCGVPPYRGPQRGMTEQTYIAPRMVREETEETKNMRKSFGFFGVATLIYAVFYAFCMFKNGSGVTFPLFIAASIVYLCLSLAKLGLKLKKGSAFYMVSMMLLAVSTFCTDDWRIIAFNKTGIFLLAMSLLLHQFYETGKWSLGKYLGNIIILWFGSIGEIIQPFIDGVNYFTKGNGRKNRNLWYVLLGAVIAVPLVIFVLVMLSMADVVFKQVTSTLIRGVSFGNMFDITFRVGFIFFATYWLISFLCKGNINEEVKDKRNGEPILAITVNIMLAVIYLLFAVIQIVYLFIGRMELPEGYTYAMYAREGFFQLLVVSILNLIIVLVSVSYFKESKVLKGILAVMSLCTFVMIASSAMRMIIYIQTYYLTFLRILVLWALALLGVLFVGVMLNIFKKNFPLFKYSMVMVTVMYMGLSFSHPDYIIAKYNIENASEQSVENAKLSDASIVDERRYKDYYYLSTLSADAAPVIVPFLEKLGYDIKDYYQSVDSGNTGMFYENYSIWNQSYYERYGDDFGYLYLSNLKASTKNFGIRTYNVSRHIALKYIEDAID